MLCFPHADGSPEKRQTVIPRMSFRFRFHMDKPAGSVFLSCKSRENFLLFAQSSEILPPGRADGFWLVDRQPLQEPAVFLSGQVPDLRRIPGPLEPPVIQTFIIEAESILFLSEYSDKKSYPQPFVIRIFLPFILRYARFPGKNMRIKIILARRCGQVHLHHPAIPDLRIQ